MDIMKRQQTTLPLFGAVSNRHLSVLFLIIVAAGYSLLSVSSRLLAEGFQPMSQVYMRVALGTYALLILFRKNLRWRHLMSAPRKDIYLLISMGTIGFSIAVYFATLGILHAKLVNVAIIFSSVPFFSYLYSAWFLKKPLDLKLIGLLILSLLGIAIVATKSFIPVTGGFGIGEWFTLISAATMAWFYVGRKLLSPHLNTQEITVSVSAIAAISSMLFAIARNETYEFTVFNNMHVLLGLLIGGLMNVIINPIEIFAFEHLDAVIGSQILLLENVFALILGYILYAESMSLPEIVGGLIVIATVYIANRLPQ